MNINIIQYHLLQYRELWFNLSMLSKECNSKFQLVLENLSITELEVLTVRLITNQNSDKLRKFFSIRRISDKLVSNGANLIIKFLNISIRGDVELDTQPDIKPKYTFDVVLRFLRSHEQVIKGLMDKYRYYITSNINSGPMTGARLNYLAQIPFNAFTANNRYILDKIKIEDITYFIERVDDNIHIPSRVFRELLRRLEKHPDRLREIIRMYGARVRFYAYGDQLMSISQYYNEMKRIDGELEEKANIFR